MSKLENGENPCLHGGCVIANEKGQVTIPPQKYAIAVGPVDVENNIMKLTGVETYRYKEVNGMVYRIGANGIEYPPITKEQYKLIQEHHKEMFKDGMDR